MSQFFNPGDFQSMIEGRYDFLRSDACMNGDKGVVVNIQKTAATLKAEFSRLEAIYKVPGTRPEELEIPHAEKAKMFELAADIAALCMMLTERTVPASRQTRLSDALPDDGIVIMQDGRPVVLDDEKAEKISRFVSMALQREQVLDEANDLMARMEEQAAEIKAGKRKRGDGNAPES